MQPPARPHQTKSVAIERRNHDRQRRFAFARKPRGIYGLLTADKIGRRPRRKGPALDTLRPPIADACVQLAGEWTLGGKEEAAAMRYLRARSVVADPGDRRHKTMLPGR